MHGILNVKTFVNFPKFGQIIHSLCVAREDDLQSHTRRSFMYLQIPGSTLSHCVTKDFEGNDRQSGWLTFVRFHLFPE